MSSFEVSVWKRTKIAVFSAEMKAKIAERTMTFSSGDPLSPRSNGDLNALSQKWKGIVFPIWVWGKCPQKKREWKLRFWVIKAEGKKATVKSSSMVHHFTQQQSIKVERQRFNLSLGSLDPRAVISRVIMFRLPIAQRIRGDICTKSCFRITAQL